MNAKSKQVLMRYIGKIDKGEIGTEDGEIDPRLTFKIDFIYAVKPPSLLNVMC